MLKKATIIGLSAVLMISTASIGRIVWRQRCIAIVFHSAVRGDSRASIETKIGDPDSSERCGEYLWWGVDSSYPPINRGECVRWVRYKLPWSSYAFGYSSDDLLVAKYHYLLE